MPRTKVNITAALFDIKPVDENGWVDVGRIEAVSARLDLRTKKASTDSTSAKLMNYVGAARNALPVNHPTYSLSQPLLKLSRVVGNQKPAKKADFGLKPAQRVGFGIGSNSSIANPELESRRYVNNFFEPVSGIAPPVSGLPMPKPRYATGSDKSYQKKLVEQNSIVELEKHLNSKLDVKKELRLIGAKVEGKARAKPSIKYPVASIKEDEYKVAEEVRPVVALAEVEKWARSENEESRIWNLESRITQKLFAKKNFWAIGLAGFMIFTVALLGKFGTSVKSEVLKNSNTAVVSLEEAKENLKTFDFVAASGNFEEAYKNFSEAGSDLNFLGASLTSVFAELPGFDKLTAGGVSKLKSVRNIVEAGRLVAESGKAMSEAMVYLSKTATILNVEDAPPQDLAVGNLKTSLLVSSANLSKAVVLLDEVDPNFLPEEKKESFVEFQSKLPEFGKLVGDAIGYVDFLENFAGPNGIEKKYLVLFQNNSELRPTGGFPGTYGVLTFKNGRLTDFKVDDVYNLDGQLREKIIPPFPLQHITPTWGMRDANWFADFSVSARKVVEFFKKEAGYKVDGVITVSPQMISDILKVVGPIELSEYGLTVDPDNFISAIQSEVEYGENREQPKRVVMDMAPLLMEKIYSANASQWLEIFNVFVAGLEQKDVMMYFDDFSLENFVAEKGFGGLVKDTRTNTDSTRTDADSDYLMVVFSNIKGSKTDKVTDNYILLNSKLETLNSKPKGVHKLTITRQHNGGSDKLGFYNKQNPAFVRILVPQGAELINISGNSKPNFKPLVSYNEGGFQEDVDLYNLESSFKLDGEKNVWTYNESGKKGFAFWMITDPGKDKTVELEYSVPLANEGGRYNMYIQKQSGLDVDDFEFKFDGRDIYGGKLDKDLEFRVKTDI